jgi:hypothetical protein
VVRDGNDELGCCRLTLFSYKTVNSLCLSLYLSVRDHLRLVSPGVIGFQPCDQLLFGSTPRDPDGLRLNRSRGIPVHRS